MQMHVSILQTVRYKIKYNLCEQSVTALKSLKLFIYFAKFVCN